MDSLLQFGLQPGEFLCPATGDGKLGRHFPGMDASSVHVLEHPGKPFGKGVVAGTAPKTAGLLEVSLRESADRTADPGGVLLDFLGGAKPQ